MKVHTRSDIIGLHVAPSGELKVCIRKLSLHSVLACIIPTGHVLSIMETKLRLRHEGTGDMMHHCNLQTVGISHLKMHTRT